MKFEIDYTGKVEERLLTYILEEYAFDIDPVVQEIIFSLAINMISLTVIESSGTSKVVEV